MRKFEKITKDQWFKDITDFVEYVEVSSDSGDTSMRVSYKYIDHYDDIKLPQRATSKSAGYDIISPVNASIMPHSEIKIPTGLKCQMLEDDVLLILIRSSLATKHGITVTNQVGVIDADYYNNPDNEGHIWLCLKNNSDKEFKINVGDRVSQAIFLKFGIVNEDIPATETRSGGFGSTGA